MANTNVYKPLCVVIKLFVHNFHLVIFGIKIREDLVSEKNVTVKGLSLGVGSLTCWARNTVII